MKKHSRREMIQAIGVAIAAAPVGAAVGCGSASALSTPTTPTTSNTTTGSCVSTADETAGPYPDATGMINNQAFYRQDIREGRSGLPLTLRLTIVNTSQACAALSGAAVEVWQCDADGHYSEYAQPGYNGTGQTFLRGLQRSDSSGQVTFLTVYPGWYSGRATHIHVEVFVNGRSVKTTQVAFPEDVTRQVYGTGVYTARGQNTTTNASDNVFSDGTSTEMATMSGDTTNGYTATLRIGVAA
jgi:protocatechuate 3,4-dioxygenase beta subunit